MSNTPVHVRLTTGEDLVATLEGPLTRNGNVHDDAEYVLKKAARIMPQQDAQGRPSLGLMLFPPLSPSTTTSVAMMGKHIMFVAPLDKQIIDNYLKLTSKLMLPDTGTGLIQTL